MIWTWAIVRHAWKGYWGIWNEMCLSLDRVYYTTFNKITKRSF